MPSFSESELSQLRRYMAQKFGHEGFALKPRERAKDSVEVLLNGEFIGTLYKDEEDGETSYDFNMSILDIDLQEAA